MKKSIKKHAPLTMSAVPVATLLSQTVGIYDPSGAFDDIRQDIQHDFIYWAQYQPETIYNAIEAAKSRERLLLLSFEPWADPNITPNPANLLSDVVARKYDAVIRQACSEIARAGQPIFVRWGHEMDQNYGRYPWSDQNDPQLYVAAYRHVIGLMKQHLVSHGVHFLWSPAGNPHAPQYWPGPDVVDIIGLSIYSYAEWDISYYGRPQNFKTIMDAKYHVAYICDPSMPVFIAEMGAYSSENPDYQKWWVAEAKELAPYYPSLLGMCYFNCKDPAEWPGAGYPDFTITPAIW
jgi:endoglucanase